MDVDVEIAVIGSGGAGLTAAIVAHDLGAEVVVLERSEEVGGTYAYSTGLVWVPNNSHMREAGIEDSAEEAKAHIRELSAGRHDEAILDSFVAHAPEAVAYLEEQVGIPFEMVPRYPDYYAERTGGKTEGRYLAPPVLPAADVLPDEWRTRLALAPQYAQVPASWREIQEWGGFGSLATWDWAALEERVGQDCRAFGSATAGFLLSAALDRGITILPETEAVSLEQSDGRVSGVRIRDAAGERVVRARRGVVLATGGYDGNDELKQRWDPHPQTIRLGSPSVDGSGLTMALELGAAFEVLDGQLLTPTYHIPGEELASGPLYRLFVREPAFPGSVIVNRRGHRFSDESFYRSVARGMCEFDAVAQEYGNHPAFFVFDHEWKMTYPLGTIAPGFVPDWLACGDTPAELAAAIGIDAEAFAATLERFNTNAAAGEDPDFRRGTTYYSRNNGDPAVRPNPCLRPLTPPLYAIEVCLGTSGTNAGLVIGPDGEVLNVRGTPIAGLYAAGNVAANLLEGLWYNSGTSNARGITFGYLAARHAMANGG